MMRLGLGLLGSLGELVDVVAPIDWTADSNVVHADSTMTADA